MNLFRPSKSDITQIEQLVKLGCNHKDIATVLLIPEAKLESWKKNNAAIDQLLKPVARPEFTITHPEYASMVEEAFVCGGKRFFRFKEEFRNSTGRYKYYYAALREVDLRMDLKKLVEYVDAFKEVLNGGKKNKGISMQSLWELVLNLETRTKLAFEPQGVKNLASIAYFDETEDLTTYDSKYGKEKIKLWEDHGINDFFLTRPISELLNLSSSSIEDLQHYLTVVEPMMADLNLGLMKVLEENS